VTRICSSDSSSVSSGYEIQESETEVSEGWSRRSPYESCDQRGTPAIWADVETPCGPNSEDNFGMRGKVFRQKRRNSFETSPVEMKGKITRSFAQQVAAFIRRYRPALEVLAKR
jgi:hypothetical protein